MTNSSLMLASVRSVIKPLPVLIVFGALCFTVYEWNFLRELSTGTARRMFGVQNNAVDAISMGSSFRSWPRRVKKNSLKRIRELVRLKANPQLLEQELQERKRLICGTEWQENYIRLHQEILEGKRPPRYLVYKCGGVSYGCGGYGNRISSISSLLYLAILTNRAFLIQWSANVSIEKYFRPNKIQWNAGTGKLRALKGRKHFWGRGFHKKVSMDTLRNLGWKSKDYSEWLKNTNLTKYFDHPVEYITSQWFLGQAVRLNKYFQQSPLVKKLGKKVKGHRYSLIGCAFEFLFSKTQYLKKRLEEAKKSLHLNQRRPTIGIHFRTGDYVLYGRKLRQESLTIAGRFLKCAKKIEDQFTKSNPALKASDINWYLATDSNEIKTFALKRFPKIKYLDVKLEHISIREPTQKGIEGVILDNMILSESDVIVLSNSSFSQSALGIGFHSLKVSTYGLTCRYKAVSGDLQ